MKKAGRYVTAMIAAVMALNFASFTAAEEVFTEEAAMELPMAETTVELPIEDEIEAPVPEMPVEEEAPAPAPEMPVQEEAAATMEENNEDIACTEDVQNEAEIEVPAENTEANEEQNTVSVPENELADETIDMEEEKAEEETVEETEENEVEEITEEESAASIEEALDPDRYVEIQLSWGEEEAAVGSTAHFTAVLHGYDNVEYTLQWQHSTDSENWENVENATDTTYDVVATKENCHDTWRVKVVITGTEA